CLAAFFMSVGACLAASALLFASAAAPLAESIAPPTSAPTPLASVPISAEPAAAGPVIPTSERANATPAPIIHFLACFMTSPFFLPSRLRRRLLSGATAITRRDLRAPEPCCLATSFRAESCAIGTRRAREGGGPGRLAGLPGFRWRRRCRNHRI